MPATRNPAHQDHLPRQGSVHRAIRGFGSESEALDRFAEFSGKWEKRYPAIIRLWENAWAEFVPFLRFDREIRTVICTTDENVNRSTESGRGCAYWLLPAAAAWYWRPVAAVKRFLLDGGEDRGSVRLVVGAADRRAKSRSWDWEPCRAA